MQTPILKIRLRGTLLATLLEAARASSLGVHVYVAELLEASAAELRAQKIALPFPLPPPGEPPPKGTRGTNGHRQVPLSAAETQKILYLTESEGMTVADIGRRLGRSQSTIRAVLKTRNQNTIRVPPAPRATVHGSRWCKTLRKSEA